MTSRRLICSFLSFLVASQGFAPLAFSEPSEVAAAKKYFLLDAKDRIAAAFDMNNVYIQHTLQCLTQMSDQQFANTRISDSKNHRPKENCDDAVAQIRENTRIKYPLMRKTLLLSQLTDSQNVHFLLMSLQNNIQLKAANKTLIDLNIKNGPGVGGIVIENPLTTFLSEEELPSPEWRPNELSDIITSPDGTNGLNSKDNFNSVWQNACVKAQQQADQAPAKLQFNFCPKSQLVLSPAGDKLRFILNGPIADARELFIQAENSKSFLPNGLRGDHKRWTEEYLAIVQLNPYIGLVQSAQPPRREFIKAFTIMSERANQSVAEFTKLRNEKNLDNDKLADYDTLLSLMRHTPITSQLVTKPGPRLAMVRKLMPMMDMDEVFKELSDEYSTQELMRVGKNVTTAVVANMLACWLPVSWVGKTVGRSVMQFTKVKSLVELFKLSKWEQIAAKTFTPICFTAGGILLNVGFLYESVQEYQNIYGEVFGSMEEETLMREVSQLSDKEREIFWSVVMFPVGIVSLKFLKTQYKNISERLWQKALVPSVAGGT